MTGNTTNLLPCIFFLLLAALAPRTAGANYPIQTELPGPKSIYTPLLIQLLEQWPPKDLSFQKDSPHPLQLRCLETPDNSFAIGLEQVMRIEKPLEEVAKVIDDIDHYQEIFTGFEKIQVESRDQNKIVTFWEQIIPSPFPNEKYHMTYLLDKQTPGRHIYRYQLKSGGSLKYSDGIIVLEADGKNATRYTEYDFFDANWGLIRVFAPSRPWRDSVEGLFLSDVAFKLRAENPALSSEEIRNQAQEALKKFPIDEVLAKRARFSLLKASD